MGLPLTRDSPVLSTHGHAAEFPLRRIKEITRALGFRLNLLAAVVFTFCALALFWAVYHLLAGAIDAEDREMVGARLREYAAIYQAYEGEGLRHWISQLQAARKEKLFLTRVTAADGRVLVDSVPASWDSADLQLLATAAAPAPPKPFVRMAPDET